MPRGSVPLSGLGRPGGGPGRRPSLEPGCSRHLCGSAFQQCCRGSRQTPLELAVCSSRNLPGHVRVSPVRSRGCRMPWLAVDAGRPLGPWGRGLWPCSVSAGRCLLPGAARGPWLLGVGCGGVAVTVPCLPTAVPKRSTDSKPRRGGSPFCPWGRLCVFCPCGAPCAPPRAPCYAAGRRGGWELVAHGRGGRFELGRLHGAAPPRMCCQPGLRDPGRGAHQGLLPPLSTGSFIF